MHYHHLFGLKQTVTHAASADELKDVSRLLVVSFLDMAGVSLFGAECKIAKLALDEQIDMVSEMVLDTFDTIQMNRAHWAVHEGHSVPMATDVI